MTKKLENLENKIDLLQSEESAIENKNTHQGFRDASRRNRIEDQLSALQQKVRREQTSVTESQGLGALANGALGRSDDHLEK